MSVLNEEQEMVLKQTIETMVDDKVELLFDYEEQEAIINFERGGCCVVNCYGNSVAATYKQILAKLSA